MVVRDRDRIAEEIEQVEQLIKDTPFAEEAREYREDLRELKREYRKA